MWGMANYRWNEFLEVALRGVGLLANSNFDFRLLALKEMARYSKLKIVMFLSE
jgi:hypothetical protein